MNNQKIVTPSGIGLAAVLRVRQLSWLVKLCIQHLSFDWLAGFMI